MSHDKRFSRSERALIAFGILVPTVFLSAVVWDKKLNDVPPFVAPAQFVPSPNALDTLHAAFGQRVASLGKRKKIDGGYGFEVNRMSDDFVSYEPDGKDEKAASAPLEKRKRLLAANEKALSTVREALGQRYGKFLTYDAAQLFPEYAEDRSLARLLGFAARTHADSGELPEATASALDAVALGVQIAGDGPLIGGLVGAACEAIARKPLWELTDKLDAKTARAALARLEKLDARRRPVARGFDTDALWTQKILAELSGSTARLVEALGYKPDESDDWEMKKMLVRFRLTDKRAALEANRKYHEAVAVRLSQPYSHAPYPNVPGDPINQQLNPYPAETAFADARNRAEVALLKAALALQAYKMEKGSYPENLDALAEGGYLKAVPGDPFGLEKPLRYKLDGAKYALWSVGPDGKDDGGKAIGGDKPRNIQAESAGDIVARINTY